MIPKIEHVAQLAHLIEAIKMSVIDPAWHDPMLWRAWHFGDELPANLTRAWNEVWTEAECQAVIKNYTALRLSR